MLARLMNQNIPVIKFEAVFPADHKIPRLIFSKATFLNKELAPISIFDEENIVEQLQTWFDRRFLNRHRLEQLKQVQDLLAPIEEDVFFANMTDQYWVQYREDQKWEDICFFKNGLPDSPYSLFNFFTSDHIELIHNLRINWNSPDVCTNGIMLKKWIQGEDGMFQLEKFSSDNHDIFREILATEILTKMHKNNFVHYKLGISSYMTTSRCDNFISENQELVPAWHILNATKNIKKDASNYDKMLFAIDYFEIPNAEDFIDEMIKIDTVLCNYDRNQGNIAFIRDTRTGKFLGPSLLYDFGAAFQFPDGNKNTYFKDREKFLYKNGQIMAMNCKPYEDFILNNNLLTDRQKSSIINSINANYKFIYENKKEYRKHNKDMSRNF